MKSGAVVKDERQREREQTEPFSIDLFFSSVPAQRAATPPLHT